MLLYFSTVDNSITNEYGITQTVSISDTQYSIGINLSNYENVINTLKDLKMRRSLFLKQA